MDGGTVAFSFNRDALHSATLQRQQGFSHTWHVFHIGWRAFIFFWRRRQNLTWNTMVEILTSAPETTACHSMWKPVEVVPKLWRNVSLEQFAGTPQCKKAVRGTTQQCSLLQVQKRFSHWVTLGRFWADVKNSTIGFDVKFWRRRQKNGRASPMWKPLNCHRFRDYSVSFLYELLPIWFLFIACSLVDCCLVLSLCLYVSPVIGQFSHVTMWEHYLVGTSCVSASDFHIGDALSFFWGWHQHLTLNPMVEFLTSAQKTTARHSMWKPLQSHLVWTCCIVGVTWSDPSLGSRGRRSTESSMRCHVFPPTPQDSRAPWDRPLTRGRWRVAQRVRGLRPGPAYLPQHHGTRRPQLQGRRRHVPHPLPHRQGGQPVVGRRHHEDGEKGLPVPHRQPEWDPMEVPGQRSWREEEGPSGQDAQQTGLLLWVMCCVSHVLCESYVVWIVWCVSHVLCESCVVWVMCCVSHVLCESCCVVWVMYCVSHVMCESHVVWVMYCVSHVLCE